MFRQPVTLGDAPPESGPGPGVVKQVFTWEHTHNVIPLDHET
jgi:hypothetical protein